MIIIIIMKIMNNNDIIVLMKLWIIIMWRNMNIMKWKKEMWNMNKWIYNIIILIMM